MSGTYTCIKGDTQLIELTFKDEAGAAINLTGSTVFFTVKKSTDDADADAIISKTQTTHSNAASGITSITLSSSDTDKTPGFYLYDIQLKDSAGQIFSSVAGSFEITADVTRRTA